MDKSIEVTVTAWNRAIRKYGICDMVYRDVLYGLNNGSNVWYYIFRIFVKMYVIAWSTVRTVIN